MIAVKRSMYSLRACGAAPLRLAGMTLLCAVLSTPAVAIEGLGLGPDVDADAKFIDLATVPLWLDVLREAGIALRDKGIEFRLEEESKSLSPLLSSMIEGPNSGVLVYATLMQGPNGDIYAPAGSLLGVTGTGTEPLDALAESYRKPALRQFVSGPVKQVYFWVKKKADGTLHASQIPVAANTKLVGEASREAVRRNELTKIVGVAGTPAAESFKLSEFWLQMEKDRIAFVAEKARQGEIARLTKQLNDQNMLIDAKFREFQSVYADYRRSAQYHATLQNVRSVLSLVEGAVTVGKAFSGDNPMQSKEPNVDIKLDGQLEVIKTTNEIKAGNAAMMLQDLQIKYKGILIYREQLKSAWEASGVPVPTVPPQADPFQSGRYPLPKL